MDTMLFPEDLDMGRWSFYMDMSNDIRRLAGDEVYDKIGQDVMDTLLARCSSNFEIIRYPDDEEIIAVINELTK